MGGLGEFTGSAGSTGFIGSVPELSQVHLASSNPNELISLHGDFGTPAHVPAHASAHKSQLSPSGEFPLTRQTCSANFFIKLVIFGESARYMVAHIAGVLWAVAPDTAKAANTTKTTNPTSFAILKEYM